MNATFDYGVSNYTEKALVETLNDLVQHVENEVVEFKLASNNFDLHKLGQYFSAISNEANLRNKNTGGLFLVWTIPLMNFVVQIIKTIRYLWKN